MAGFGTSAMLHPAILKALAIKAIAGSTFHDAERVLILIQ